MVTCSAASRVFGETPNTATVTVALPSLTASSRFLPGLIYVAASPLNDSPATTRDLHANIQILGQGPKLPHRGFSLGHGVFGNTNPMGRRAHVNARRMRMNHRHLRTGVQRLAPTSNVFTGRTTRGTSFGFHGWMNVFAVSIRPTRAGLRTSWFCTLPNGIVAFPKTPAANFTNVFIAVQRNHANGRAA